MTAKRLALFSLVLWCLTIGFIATKMINGHTMAGSDGRTAVILSSADRDFVLGEMRTMLGAVHDVTMAIAAHDNAALADAATSAGMVHAGHEPPGLLAALPLDFKKMGFGMHGAFDDLAKAARSNTLSQSEQSAQLAGILQRCIGCHASYRFEVPAAH